MRLGLNPIGMHATDREGMGDGWRRAVVARTAHQSECRLREGRGGEGIATARPPGHDDYCCPLLVGTRRPSTKSLQRPLSVVLGLEFRWRMPRRQCGRGDARVSRQLRTLRTGVLRRFHRMHNLGRSGRVRAQSPIHAQRVSGELRPLQRTVRRSYTPVPDVEKEWAV